MNHKERLNKCCECGARITSSESPYIRISTTGHERRWHVGCDRGGK